MAYTIRENQLGMQAIGALSSTPNHPGGTLVRAYDPSYGDGEFIYLKSVASTLLGSIVNGIVIAASLPTWQTALLPNAGNSGQPVAISMAADATGGNWGWYQVAGTAVALTTGTFAAAGPAFIGGIGLLISTAAAGKQLLNAYGLTAVGTPAANQILLQCNRPFVQGQIT